MIAPKPKNIFIITNTAWNAWNFRRGLIESFLQAGHLVTVIAPTDDYVESITGLGVEFVSVDISSEDFSFFRCVVALSKVLNLTLKLKPDCIFSFTILPNFISVLTAIFFPKLKVFPNVAGLGRAFASPQSLKSKLMSVLYRSLFWRANVVFVQNPDDFDLLKESKAVRTSALRLLPGSGVTGHIQATIASQVPDVISCFYLLDD